MMTLICYDRLGTRPLKVNPDKLSSMFARHELEKLQAGKPVRKGGRHKCHAKQRRVYRLFVAVA